MSDAVILGVVAMVCITLGVPSVLAVIFGRQFFGRATEKGIDISVGADGTKPAGRKRPPA